MARGRLRVYLGAAPGVGKTYAMLAEGRRRCERGHDVVVGFVETHGRARTAEMLECLEVVPRVALPYRGSEFTEMDVDAVLARQPEQVLVDELAHTNVPGSRNAKRYQDVEELLAAGIDVISTVNIQHLESINDVVTQITGVVQRETLPDEVVRVADQIELADMDPQAIRRRMAHGNIYPPERINAALANYFRVGNLTALRELALLWLADRVDEGLQRYRASHAIAESWEARERVVVALTGGSEGEALIRRAKRIAARSGGGDLYAVHVARSDGLTAASPARLAQHRALVESLGGSYHAVVGDDVPAALLEFARGVEATQLVLGASRRPRWQRGVAEGVAAAVTRQAGPIDVHLVTHPQARQGRSLPRLGAGLSPRRRLAGLVATLIGLPALTAGLSAARPLVGLNGDLLVFLLAVIAVALLGGLGPALLAAVGGALLLNFFFTPPLYTLTIATGSNILALVVFVVVGLAMAAVVDRAATRARQAARAAAEAETLRTLAGSVLRGHDALPALLERTRETFAMDAVALLERADDGAWQQLACVGEGTCARPEDADVTVAVRDNLQLALRGRALPSEDRRVLDAFAVYATEALERGRLARQASEAATLAEADRTRSALLSAVSHDLRTPLTAIKAAVTSLRATDVTWEPDDEAELLATVDESADRLDDLIANLLDMSRLQVGTLAVHPRPAACDAIVHAALATTDADQRVITRELESLPAALADPGLAERVLANLVSNALRYTPPAEAVLVHGSATPDRIEIRVVDRGPGITPDDRERIFTPFQRLGDATADGGIGLGLAVSLGLAEAMGGTLTPEDTPGGGLTMVLTLPRPGADDQPDQLPRMVEENLE